MTTRRDFIKKTVAGTAALSLGSILPGFGSSRYQDILGANEKIRIGVIGVNSRGSALAQGFAKQPDCEVTYICDVDSRALEKCQAVIHKLTGRTPKGEKDIRKMLESNEFEAVVIATPDHWHAKAAIMAMQAGKHVYLEKPTSHNPAENEMLVRATLKYNRIVQVGNQRRSFPNVIKAMEEIKSGTIGKVRYAKSWYVNNRPSIGTGKVIPVPDYLDWDLWQGPAPRVPDFKDNFIHYNWHWFWNWGTGEALNNGTHFVDMLRWGLGVDYPTKVDSIGGRYRFQDDWQTPDTQLITFQFGDEASFSWEGRSCNTMPVDGYGVGTAFYGDTGTLFIGGGNEYKIADIKGKTIKEVKSDLKFETGNLLNPSEKLDSFHFRNWFDAIRKGTKLNSGIVDACISTQLVQLGNIAQRVGHSLQIDPGSGRILNDLEANKLWGREYEKGWEIRVYFSLFLSLLISYLEIWCSNTISLSVIQVAPLQSLQPHSKEPPHKKSKETPQLFFKSAKSQFYMLLNGTNRNTEFISNLLVSQGFETAKTKHTPTFRRHRINHTLYCFTQFTIVCSWLIRT